MRPIDASTDISEIQSIKKRVKETTTILLDVIDEWGGGESWLKAPDGKQIRCDVGYLYEGLNELKRWAYETD